MEYALGNALSGSAKDEVLSVPDSGLSAPKVMAIADGKYRNKSRDEIVGQLAGAYYGVQGIPEGWLETLWMRDEIQATADALLAVSPAGR
ncbi:hypothetical protein AZH11_13535 [Pseudomonas simiae]|nr:hypothetical protein AZH11_13535 [Pseudomonas simiae]